MPLPRAVRGRVLRAACRVGILAALVGVGPARAQTYEIDPTLTDAGFTVTYLGVARERGRFDRVIGRIVLDPTRRSGTIDLAFDSASISTGWTLRDEFLRGERMFDVRRYPWLRFRSRHLDYGADGLTGVDGDVTLRGVTRPVRLTVRRLVCAFDPRDGREACDAEIVGRISRAEFGMTYAYPLVGDDVDFDILVTVRRD
jgi:polyisoprenoid-binding protein YceI